MMWLWIKDLIVDCAPWIIVGILVIILLMVLV